MGADTFGNMASGKTADAAFKAATEQARHDHGHAGYTGTIAEKRDFSVIAVPAGKDPVEYAGELLDKADPRVDDKWGPAGCVKVAEGKWYFFGWASS